MEINSLQGANAYTNALETTPPTNDARLRDQNLEASRTDLNTESAQAAQKAFEVELTQEAQDRMATERTQEQTRTQAQTTAPENQTDQNPVPTQEQSQIVNIVA